MNFGNIMHFKKILIILLTTIIQFSQLGNLDSNEGEY